MTSDLQQRSVGKIARLAGEPRDLAAFWRECTDVVAAVVPHYWTPSRVLRRRREPDGRCRDLSYRDLDPARATDGDPSTSQRWHFNQDMGSDQEMIARLRAPSGEVWGMLGLYREPGQPMFDEADKQFVRAASAHLNEGARRALLVGEATDAGALSLTRRGW